MQCAGWLLYQRNLKLSALATQYAAFVQRDGELAKQACKRSFEGYGVGLPYHKLSQIRNWVGDNSAMPLLEMKKAVERLPTSHADGGPRHLASSFNFNAPLESTIGQLNLHLNRLRVSEDNLVQSDQARSAHATNVHAGIDIMTSMIDKAEAHHVMLKVRTLSESLKRAPKRPISLSASLLPPVAAAAANGLGNALLPVAGAPAPPLQEENEKEKNPTNVPVPPGPSIAGRFSSGRASKAQSSGLFGSGHRCGPEDEVWFILGDNLDGEEKNGSEHHWFNVLGARSRVPRRDLDNKVALGRMRRDFTFDKVIPDLKGSDGETMKNEQARMLGCFAVDRLKWMKSGPFDCSHLVSRHQTHQYSSQMATQSVEVENIHCLDVVVELSFFLYIL